MSVPESRSGRCSRASLRRIPRSVFLNACTRVPFVRISVCTRDAARMQSQEATAVTSRDCNAGARYILSARVVQTKDITLGLLRKYIPSIVPAFLITASSVFRPKWFYRHFADNARPRAFSAIRYVKKFIFYLSLHELITFLLTRILWFLTTSL